MFEREMFLCFPLTKNRVNFLPRRSFIFFVILLIIRSQSIQWHKINFSWSIIFVIPIVWTRCFLLGLEPPTQFSKKKKGVRLERISIFREGLLGKWGWPFLGGCSFYIKNKLKSEIFNMFINKSVFLGHN